MDMLYSHMWLRGGVVRGEWLESKGQRSQVWIRAPRTMKNSVKLELEQLPGTMKLELVGEGFPGLKQKKFDPFLGILKIQITAGW